LSGELVIILAAVLGVMFSLAATAGVYAVYRVNKQATTVAEYKGMADRAQQNAQIWQDRSEATQAELDAAVRDLTRANDKIANLQSQVSHLEGVITARAEISELTRVVGKLAETVSGNHTAQMADHAKILERLGAVA
jgi:flagellar motility protein MotE (MotC chaperone)